MKLLNLLNALGFTKCQRPHPCLSFQPFNSFSLTCRTATDLPHFQNNRPFIHQPYYFMTLRFHLDTHHHEGIEQGNDQMCIRYKSWRRDRFLAFSSCKEACFLYKSADESITIFVNAPEVEMMSTLRLALSRCE